MVAGGDLAVGGRVDAGGELHTARNAVVDGNLAVNGELALGELRVARNAAVGGGLTVGGRVDAGGELHTGGKVVVGGGLDVAGESVFSGMLNANALLAVQNGGQFLLAVNDEQVVVTNKLRVHGESVSTGVSSRSSGSWSTATSTPRL
ncbi:hypothetical protein LO772_30805 [Yinghuangia sp. ASG 101]|uniref:hypothetical protein n=1 Tax=Yinghuangia sp. ASG 101 TaxID=2896848 RepID=UPI001E54ADBD|nr:hypothetical protein [Yinghuangia sp. ASG 101]UGQ11148.1 hypothetical protein LO772_30805 [Yinghuangia sp. ASG 101]